MNVHSLVARWDSGLGREVVRLFVQEGHTVSVIGRNAPCRIRQVMDRGILLEG